MVFKNVLILTFGVFSLLRTILLSFQPNYNTAKMIG